MKAAILGFGTVGSGAYETLQRYPGPAEIKKILARHIPEGKEGLVTVDPAEILEDPEIEAVAEAMGGLHPAYEYVCEALKRGKSVASANKLLICRYYRELHALAAEHGAELRFTPAVGGGIPWLHNLRRTARCDRILRFRGIMNGTTNYILDAMQSGEKSFAEALAEAQRLGYAEADPSADIDGLDARRKCALSASLAFGCVLSEEDVPSFSLRNIREEDIENIRSAGYVCRFLARAEKTEKGICAYTEPSLLQPEETEAGIRGNYNCMTLEAEMAGKLSFIGQGAGKKPTGSSLAEDLIDIAASAPQPSVCLTQAQTDLYACRHRYYLRSRSIFPEKWISGRCGSALLTVPFAPAEMHHLAGQIYDEDPFSFLAGISEVQDEGR